MAHVQIVVDGQEYFNDEVDGWQAPPATPAAPDAEPGPQPSPPARVKPLLLLALGKAMHRALDEGPLLAPLSTELITRASGFTLSADIDNGPGA